MPFNPIARFYDAHHGQISADIPAYLGFARQTGGPVLDLGVGTGRLALALAKAGYTVTGVDSAPAMLALARRRLAAAHLETQIKLVEGNFQAFDLAGERFGLAICGFNGFLHLIDEDEQLAALRCWRRHLRQDGLLLIDVENPNLARLAASDGSLELAEAFIDEESGHQIYALFASWVTFADQVHEIHLIYDEMLDDGSLRRSATHFPTRILFRRELGLLLATAGYRHVQFYGDYDLAPWTPASPRLLAAAQP
jgi:ubiquinone/menaquinone biosynthesis C-methylase UbiE